MARPKHDNPRKEVHYRLPEDLIAKLDLLCLDTFTGKIRLGIRNEHVENALRDYFDKYYPQKPQPLEFHYDPRP